MDTPTHGLIGRLLARSLWPGREERGLVNLVLVIRLDAEERPKSVVYTGGSIDASRQ